MDSKQSNSIIYSKNTIEFVTVAVQYCSYLEEIEKEGEVQAIDKLTKILPLLYLKVLMIAPFELDYDIYSEVTVTEADYDYILAKTYNLFKVNDSYLEVFIDDMKYSDTPISASIAENLTDIYQDLKNFISIYEIGNEESMLENLYICLENFKLYWGQKLVNVLRALHSLKYSTITNEIQDGDSFDENIEEEW